MKNQREHGHASKSKFRGFYTALGISLLMIAAACVFAYQQTSTTLEENLESLTEQMEMATTFTTHSTTQTTTTIEEVPVIGVQTDLEKETTTVIESTTAETTVLQTESITETESEEIPAHQLVPPLAEYSILNPFSDGELVKSETTGTWQTHNGVDLGCETGADVFSIDTGTVTEVCHDALWGYTVTIDHDNGVVSRYCGLDGSLEVREGDAVQSGQKIGTVGNTADIESALDSHLHLEIQKSGTYIDPVYYFGS